MPADNSSTDDVERPEVQEHLGAAPGPVVVRRHAGLAALVGAAASAVAIAYLWRASQTMTAVDWALCLAMSAVATVYLATLVDSRTPLVVADGLGVRIRLGNEWRGLPWEAIEEVVVRPRRGLLRDGRLVFVPHSLARALDGLEGRPRRQARANQRMYGSALAVPIGLTTKVVSDGHRDLAEEIAALAQERAGVLLVEPGDDAPADADIPDSSDGVDAADGPTEPEQEDDASGGTEVDGAHSGGTRAAFVPDETGTNEAGPARDDGRHEDDAVDHAPAGLSRASAPPPMGEQVWPRTARSSILGELGTIVSRVAKRRFEQPEDPDDLGAREQPAGADDPHGAPGGREAPAEPVSGDGGTLPLRRTRPAVRAHVTRDVPASHGTTALAPEPAAEAVRDERDLHRPGRVDLEFEPVAAGRVRPISTLGDPVEPLVIDDFVTEPAYDPIIGPELAAARTRLGLTVDELADRTRIRPHVIESIEVDDFAPCGGDFYARGHLRTLARVLGKDAGPLLAAFDERYATAPVNARRVFEAELATGNTGSMRSTMGGPNWGLLVGVVLVLALVWAAVRLVSGDTGAVEDRGPVLNGSAGISAPAAGEAGEAGAPREQAEGAGADLLPLTLVASGSDSDVVVRDGSGAVVFSGELVLGERKRLRVAPPVRVRAADAGAIEVRVAGEDRGPLGESGSPGRRTFR